MFERFEGVPQWLYLTWPGRLLVAESGQYALASVCLRAVLERDPDHKEARRLLGYVPHGGGWATPFAVRQLEKNNVNHPTFGWVPADWVPIWSRASFPPRRARVSERPQWLPVAEADRLQGRLEPALEVRHRALRDPDERASGRSHHLRPPPRGLSRPVHDPVADILGENLPLDPPFQESETRPVTACATTKLHQVWYFASKAEFVEHLSPTLGPEVALNLGFYDPPKSGRGRVPAYFYRDPDGQIPEIATLYHEVSHQLLFETAGPNSYTKNTRQFLGLRGIGDLLRDRHAAAGRLALKSAGWSGPASRKPINSLVVRHEVGTDGGIRGLRRSHIPRQGSDLPQLPASNGLDRLPDAVESAEPTATLSSTTFATPITGESNAASGRSLKDRLHQPYATLEKQFLTFLKDGKASAARPGTEPRPRAARSGRCRSRDLDAG